MSDPVQSTKVILWLGESLGFWIQTGAFLLSALAAAYIIYHNGKLARLRATIDLVMHQKSDQDLLRCIEEVYRLNESQVKFSTLDLGSAEGKCVLRVLNNHEFIAGGIRSGAFSESLYKQMQCSNVLKVYAASQAMIIELRNKDKKDTIFQDFEWLAARWKVDPLKKK
ncbi:DUF4760 domain-containing protein [Duganella dendranthematis]|uniref:DUF4760 domain-containing protein n=1 Tax=Duganella dendranthematis TaxID=2728021 RepID=A0ABX6M579_9BURK|nr:DUF4760 domain-containing protein [Duganella dendranthematis]QJD89131.1 DUF4760 domain-containing protein [Duganella dendranthematis]